MIPSLKYHTLRSETFADQPNREIIVFRGNKLSRMANFKIFRGRRKNEGKSFFIIRLFSVNLYNSAKKVHGKSNN